MSFIFSKGIPAPLIPREPDMEVIDFEHLFSIIRCYENIVFHKMIVNILFAPRIYPFLLYALVRYLFIVFMT